MTQEHLIRPPHELVQQWVSLACENEGYETWQDLATEAARWGADQELEACCEWIYKLMDRGLEWSMDLRIARRPKPSSLKEQALEVLNAWCEERNGPGESILCDGLHVHTIRQALELLND